MSETPQQARLTLLGRTMLAEAGFTDADLRKVHDRLVEGMDATKIKLFQSEGAVIESEPHVDHTERRLAAVEVARLADWYPNKLEHEVHGDVTFRVTGLDGDRV